MRIKLSLGLIMAIIVIGLFYGMAGWRDVELGEVGIRVTMVTAPWNADQKGETIALTPGTRFVDPILYDLDVYSTLYEQYEFIGEDAVQAQTTDGQPVNAEVSFQIGLIEADVPWLAANVGRNWYAEVFRPQVRDIVRSAVGTEPSSAVYTGAGRDRVSALIQNRLEAELVGYGIRFETNLRDISFLNEDFVNVLEQKAIAFEAEEINRRNAVAAEQEAIRVQNVAQGARFQVQEEADAERYKLEQEGIGAQLRDEAIAAGNLALFQAEAEGVRLRREALSGEGGAELVSIAWAENVGSKIEVWGVPTGAPGTSSIMDMNGILQNAFRPPQ